MQMLLRVDRLPRLLQRVFPRGCSGQPGPGARPRHPTGTLVLEMARQQRRIDRVLEPAYVAELASCSFDDVRSRHSECLEIETEVSYVRRLAQPRLDIMRAELDRRAAGGSVGDLIAALPRILADEGPRAPAT